MDNNSKRKQVHEYLYFFYTTSCREVKREKQNQKYKQKYHSEKLSDREIRIYVTHPTPKYLFKGWGIRIYLFSIISNTLPDISFIFCSSRAFQRLLPCSNLISGLEVMAFQSSQVFHCQHPSYCHVAPCLSCHLTWCQHDTDMALASFSDVKILST